MLRPSRQQQRSAPQAGHGRQPQGQRQQGQRGQTTTQRASAQDGANEKLLIYWLNSLDMISCLSANTVDDLRDGSAFTDMAADLGLPVDADNTQISAIHALEDVMNSLSNAMELPHELADLGVAKAIVKGDRSIILHLLAFFRNMYQSRSSNGASSAEPVLQNVSEPPNVDAAMTRPSGSFADRRLHAGSILRNQGPAGGGFVSSVSSSRPSSSRLTRHKQRSAPSLGNTGASKGGKRSSPSQNRAGGRASPGMSSSGGGGSDVSLSPIMTTRPSGSTTGGLRHGTRRISSGRAAARRLSGASDSAHRSAETTPNSRKGKQERSGKQVESPSAVRGRAIMMQAQEEVTGGRDSPPAVLWMEGKHSRESAAVVTRSPGSRTGSPERHRSSSPNRRQRSSSPRSPKQKQQGLRGGAGRDGPGSPKMLSAWRREVRSRSALREKEVHLKEKLRDNAEANRKLNAAGPANRRSNSAQSRGASSSPGQRQPAGPAAALRGRSSRGSSSGSGRGAPPSLSSAPAAHRNPSPTPALRNLIYAVHPSNGGMSSSRGPGTPSRSAAAVGSASASPMHLTQRQSPMPDHLAALGLGAISKARSRQRVRSNSASGSNSLYGMVDGGGSDAGSGYAGSAAGGDAGGRSGHNRHRAVSPAPSLSARSASTSRSVSQSVSQSVSRSVSRSGRAAAKEHSTAARGPSNQHHHQQQQQHQRGMPGQEDSSDINNAASKHLNHLEAMVLWLRTVPVLQQNIPRSLATGSSDDIESRLSALFKDGYLMCQLMQYISRQAQITCSKNSNKRASMLQNWNQALAVLRLHPRMPSTFLFAEDSFVKGESSTIIGLLTDMHKTYCVKRIDSDNNGSGSGSAAQRHHYADDRTESALDYLVGETSVPPSSSGVMSPFSSPPQHASANARSSRLTFRKDEVPNLLPHEERQARSWLKGCQLLPPPEVEAGPVLQNSLRTGIVFVDILVMAERMRLDGFVRKPKTLHQARDNVTKALSLLRQKHGAVIPPGFFSDPDGLVKGNFDLLWGLLHRLSALYPNLGSIGGGHRGGSGAAAASKTAAQRPAGAADQPAEQPDADAAQPADIQMQLLLWLHSLGLVKGAIGRTPVLEDWDSVLKAMRSGTVLVQLINCLEEQRVMALSDSKGSADMRATENVLRATEHLMALPFMPPEFLVVSDIVRGDVKICVGLLACIQSCYYGPGKKFQLPASFSSNANPASEGSQTTRGRTPNSGRIAVFEDAGPATSRIPHFAAPTGMSGGSMTARPGGGRTQNENVNPRVHDPAIIKRFVTLVPWLKSVLPRFNATAALGDQFSDGLVLVQILGALERSAPLKGITKRGNLRRAEKMNNVTRVLEKLQTNKSMPLEFLHQAPALVGCDPEVTLSLLEQMRKAYKSHLL